MAEATLDAAPLGAKTPLSSAYWDGALTLESIGCDLDRLAETAWALSGSEAINEVGQHSCFSLAMLAKAIARQAKEHEDRMADLSKTFREAR